MVLAMLGLLDAPGVGSLDRAEGAKERRDGGLDPCLDPAGVACREDPALGPLPSMMLR